MLWLIALARERPGTGSVATSGPRVFPSRDLATFWRRSGITLDTLATQGRDRFAVVELQSRLDSARLSASQ